MTRGTCPACDELVEILATGEEIPGRGSQRYWKVAEHDILVRYGAVPVYRQCEGSGKKI